MMAFSFSLLREVSDVTANFPFWIDHRRLIARHDEVRSVRQSGNKESFDMHPIVSGGFCPEGAIDLSPGF
jgi:hypothetical protein